MNDNIVFGQYIYKNSFIHKLDPRIKLFVLLILMIGTFLVPADNFILLSIALMIPLIAVIFSKISIFKYLKSLKQIVFVIFLSFIFQLFGNEGGKVYNIPINFSYANLILAVLLIVLFFLFRKYLPFKMLIFIGLVVLIIYLLRFPLIGNPFKETSIHIYEKGLIHGTFLIERILIIILASTTLTLTTKPTDLTNALEWYLTPLEKIKIKTSIFAMMISIALRFIPTLFNETNKILKAQASRGVDFNEGKFIEQIKQIVSLLVPMFVISIKRAEDLADAMEARCYVPGEKRTKLVKMKCKVTDYLVMLFILTLFILLILIRCGVIYAL